MKKNFVKGKSIEQYRTEQDDQQKKDEELLTILRPFFIHSEAFPSDP